jgi:hypothetical protein
MDVRQYSINVSEEVRKYGQLGLPTLIEMRPDQHKAATGKPDGFLLCMANGVPVKVLSSVTSGKIKFTRRNGTDIAEMTYTADSNPPYGWRE